MLAAIPLGNTLALDTVHDGIRTPAARATVLAIAARDAFAFASNNPFSANTVAYFAERGNYTKPFWFLWHDTSGELHATRIDKSGAILREVTSSEVSRSV